jgi:ubiquinone/menaquinone biosynthesis C-methylase UbiE
LASVDDADSYREAQHEQWDRSAAGWARRRERVQSAGMPASTWMVDAIRPQPGHVVLELAAGPGDTGFLAAELIEPGGALICSDASEAMLDVARGRAAELGIENVEFLVVNAEWIDLETAAVDGVLCRWGYMLLADPAAALRETRRVIRPGGRVALAAWDAPELNPWVAVPVGELVARELAPAPDRGAPGMFAFAAEGRLERLLEEAGFSEIVVESLELRWSYEDFDDYWETTLDLGRPLAQLIAGLDDARRDDLRAAVARAFEQHTDPGGALSLPARTLVASATA